VTNVTACVQPEDPVGRRVLRAHIDDDPLTVRGVDGVDNVVPVAAAADGEHPALPLGLGAAIRVVVVRRVGAHA
jgi:hypothetical protein